MDLWTTTSFGMKKETLAICNIMRKYGFSWGCQARVDAIADTDGPSLRYVGPAIYIVDLGVESFNEDILKLIKKGITQKQIYDAIGYRERSSMFRSS